MATIIPSAALVRRLIPTFVVEAALLAVCVLAYVYTEQLGWIFGVFAIALGSIVWILYVTFTHRDEWRWYDGTPGARK